MMKKCLERNKKVSFIGMRLIIFMMLFVVANNLMVINASALVLYNFSVGGTGSVNNGNGYFDDQASFFNYTGDSRNVYAISEDTQVLLVEPLGRANGFSGALTVINSSLGTLNDAVVHKGYIYFIDGTTLKKKKSRNDGSLCESTDTGTTGCIMELASGVGEALQLHNNVLYFTVGIDSLRHLDLTDNSATDFAISYPTSPYTKHRAFALATKNSSLQAYIFTRQASTRDGFDICTASGCTDLYNSLVTSTTSYGTMYTLQNYVYVLWFNSLGTVVERLYSISNDSITTVDYSASDSLGINRRAYVGGQSMIGLIVQSSTTYETYNSNEAGEDSLLAVPAELTYTTKTIESLDATYYNRSTIYLQYNVILNTLNLDNLFLDFDDYRWTISLTDPNGVSQDIVQTPKCQYSGVLDTTCQIFSSMGINAPQNGWLAGSWTAKLYEINIVAPNRALIATSASFTVLNTSLENQSIAPPPFIPITSGTAPQTISQIDGFVSLLGMGVNSVSKLLFAMIFIAIATVVGLVYSNGNVAMVLAFVPYAFFTFIDYIPKWIFIITIILMAIVSRAFR